MIFTANLNSRRIAIVKPFTLVSVYSKEKSRLLGEPVVTPSVATVQDREVNRINITRTEVSDYLISYNYFGGYGPAPITFASSNTPVATVNQNGLVSHISNGTSVITVAVPSTGVSFSTPSLTLSTTVSSSNFDNYVNYVSGSLARSASDAVDTRLVGKSSSTALRIFTLQDHANSNYTRNPNVWCSDLDLTCFSPYNSIDLYQRAGTLISPRHIIFAWHFPIANGATVRFVKMDGTVVNRTMTNSISISNGSNARDIWIGVLDSDVPAGISFAKILPTNWDTKLPSVNSTFYTIPCLVLDQEEKALISDWQFETDLTKLKEQTTFKSPTDVKRLQFYENLIDGDSGNPAFLIVNNQLVLLTVWTGGGAGSGSSVRYHRDEINAIMTTLGGGYQLTSVDLSSFPNY